MFMISSRDFTCSSCSMVTVVVTCHSSRRSTPPRWTPTGNGLQRGQSCWPPLGKTVGRQRAATWPPLGRISWPPTLVERISSRDGPPYFMGSDVLEAIRVESGMSEQELVKEGKLYRWLQVSSA